MAEPFTASVQYDDLKGNIAIDGFDGPPLSELAERTNMPTGYFPVGFQIHRLNPDIDGAIPISVVAVRSDEVGMTMDEIIQYSVANSEVPVYTFQGKLLLSDVPFLFKRFDLKARTKSLMNANLMVYSSP